MQNDAVSSTANELIAKEDVRMLDTDYEYIIESVQSKYPEKRTLNHDMIIGKRCILTDDQEQPYFIGAMIIEPFGNHCSSRWFYTTAVQRFEKFEDGRIEMETENSIYSFRPI